MHFYQPNALQPYEDPEVSQLQLKIQVLVQQLAELQQTKSDIEQEILMLHTRHRQELGHLVAELLQLRRDQRQRATPPEDEAQPADLPPDSDEVDTAATAGSDKSKLSLAERHKLKEMFRQASKLCHPDLVAPQFKAEASVIFIELRTAYEQHNLLQVEEILHGLERGEELTKKPAWGQDKNKLQAEISYLETKIKVARHEVDKLEHSNVYQKLLKIDDWDDYFDDLRLELQQKINRLKRKKPQPVQDSKETSTKEQDSK